MPNTPPTFSGTIPENYDRYLGPYIFEPYARHVVECAASGTPGNILEIACGTGRVTRHLQKTFPGARLIATDFNNDMINIARQLTPGTNIEWQTADAQELPFEDRSFDLVVFQFGLMFVSDKQKALAEARRVLKPGGRLLFSTWDRLENNPAFNTADRVVKKYFPIDPPRFFHLPFSLYDDDQLTAWTKAAGFTDVRASLVKFTGYSPSAADTAAGMLEGSPMYATLNELAPGQLPVIKEDLTNALAEEFGEAPLTSPTQAWVVDASTFSPGPSGTST
ncbi:MAG: methyltransferase domain-containing protein [Sphingobacteriales bacterium]|nr:methyltransferase domain-containing protein [Sphingobacteriales bacterium]